MDASLTRRTLLTSAAALASVGAVGLTAGPAFAARAEVPLPDGIQPEGITSGPGAVFFVGSLNDGRIVTGDLLRGTTRELLPGAAGRQLRGLFFDERTGLVWAAGNVGDVAHVWAVRSTSGTVVQDTVVPGGRFLNDLVVQDDSLWVTDSLVDRLTRIPLGRGGWPTGGGPEFLPLSGAWPSFDGSANNANGIRTLPGGLLLLDNSRVGGLWQVNPSTGRVREIPIAGSPAIIGGDGVERRGTTAYVVRGSDNASVTKVELARGPSGWAGTVADVLRDDRLDVPSTATFAAGGLYAVNARFGTASPTTARYWVTRLPL